MAATEQLLAPIAARVRAGKLAGAGPIGVEVGQVISKYKTGKYFNLTITDDSLVIERDQARIDVEAALNGFCMLRTPVPASLLGHLATLTCNQVRFAGAGATVSMLTEPTSAQRQAFDSNLTRTSLAGS